MLLLEKAAQYKVKLDNSSGNIDFSVLIRTKNEGHSIGRLLESLLSQSCNSFEVIIVDSGSKDNTLAVADKYPVRIYEINEASFTFGYSLNYGFEKAKGKYVVCLSAHALPQSDDFLHTVLRSFHDERVAAVMTKTLPWPDCNPFDRRGLLKKFNLEKMDIAREKLFLFSNANSVIRRSVWEKIPFNENIIASEDLEWQLRIREQNYKIIYEPDAAVYHSHNETLQEIYRRSYREEFVNRLLHIRSYPFWKVIADISAGSLYDMFYVLLEGENLKWFFFAPLRRIVMNYGRYKANRDCAIHK